MKKIFKEVGRYLSVVFAAFFFAYAIRAFINKAGLLTGGVSGVSLLMSRYIAMIKYSTDLNSLLANDEQMIFVNTLTSIIYFSINIPIIYLAFKKLGKRFAILSTIFILTNTFLIRFIPLEVLDVFDLENNKLAYGIFAGVFVGTAVSIALNVGGSSGGTEVIATYLSRKKQISIGKILMMINGIIILLGGILLKEWTPMLYTLVFIYINGRTIDALHRLTRKIEITVVTNKASEVANVISDSTHYSSSRWEIIGGYTGSDKSMVVIVVPEKLTEQIVYLVREIDQNSFITTSETLKVYGNFHLPIK